MWLKEPGSWPVAGISDRGQQPQVSSDWGRKSCLDRWHAPARATKVALVVDVSRERGDDAEALDGVVQSEADDQQQWSEWPWLTARLSKARIELRRQEAWQGEALGSGWCSPVGTGLRLILELSTDALMLAAPLLGCVVCVCTMPARSPQLCWLTSTFTHGSSCGSCATPMCR